MERKARIRAKKGRCTETEDKVKRERIIADYFLNPTAYCLPNCKPTLIFNEKGDFDSLL